MLLTLAAFLCLCLRRPAHPGRSLAGRHDEALFALALAYSPSFRPVAGILRSTPSRAPPRLGVRQRQEYDVYRDDPLTV